MAVIKDEEIIYDALRRYTAERQAFARYMHDPGAVKEDGTPFTDEEKAQALQIARQCQRILDYCRAKVESPIIMLQ